MHDYPVVKLIGIIQEAPLYPPFDKVIILPTLYGNPPSNMEEFAAEVQEIRVSRQGFVSGDGWQYKPGQDCSELRIRFAFDKQTSKLVKMLEEHAETRGRDRMMRVVRDLEEKVRGAQLDFVQLEKEVNAFNTSPWYKRVWIALFSQV